MVGIVILDYNNAEDTLNCLESIMQFNTYPAKIVIVDNGSTKTEIVKEIDTRLSGKYIGRYMKLQEGEKVPDRLADITLYVSRHNDGYAQGNNKGLNLLYRFPDIKNVMILNSDILFVEDIIGRLVGDLQSVPDAAIVSPILYKKGLQEIDYNCARKSISPSDLFLEYMFLFHDVFNILSTRRKRRNLLRGKEPLLDKPLLEIELPSGSCMIADKEFFKSIGSFDPNTFLYNEENILWVKIDRLGKKNYLDTRLKCIHLGATTIDNKAASDFILNCSIESNHYFLKHYTNVGCVYLFFMRIFYQMLRLKIKLRRLLK